MSSTAFDRAWASVRDVATFALGAWWGNGIMEDPAPADPWKIAVVAGMLSLPFAWRADELWRRSVGRQPQPPPSPQQNGKDPATDPVEL